MATLPFSTKWPARMGGGDTEFVQKILAGLYINDLITANFLYEIDNKYFERFGNFIGIETSAETFDDIQPKLTTIRHDPHNLWVSGRKIHMVINNRTAKRFQFAPVMEVKSVQKVEITSDEFNSNYRKITIDGTDYSVYNQHGYDVIQRLSLNDGFESVIQFFRWFNTDFNGKIIHWTPLKY